MIIGNEPVTKSFSHLMNRYRETGLVSFPFILVEGPEHTGKSTMIVETIEEFLGSYQKNDFLWIKDCSDFIDSGKHPLRVTISSSDKDRIIKISKTESYENLDTREMISWLSVAPVGKFKVIFLENIERMTVAAQNSFLKTFEEPLPGRIIVASCGNKSALLETILSRAFVLTTQLLDSDSMEKFARSLGGDFSEEYRDSALVFARGRPGYLKRIFDNFETFERVFQIYLEYKKIFNNPREYTKKNSLLQEVVKLWQIQEFFYALIYDFSRENRSDLVAQYLSYAARFDQNVKPDSIVFESILW